MLILFVIINFVNKYNKFCLDLKRLFIALERCDEIIVISELFTQFLNMMKCYLCMCKIRFLRTCKNWRWKESLTIIIVRGGRAGYKTYSGFPLECAVSRQRRHPVKGKRLHLADATPLSIVPRTPEFSVCICPSPFVCKRVLVIARHMNSRVRRGTMILSNEAHNSRLEFWFGWPPIAMHDSTNEGNCWRISEDLMHMHNLLNMKSLYLCNHNTIFLMI